ncbi:MAG TPA: restriction endonuclease [Anaerolineae bacterium]|nr:restriction endonuclease [Anaerolineae bacterium]
MAKKPKRIDVTKISLEEWLDLLSNLPGDESFFSYEFPTNNHREEYISTIQNRTDKEIKKLIKNFLISSGSLGIDEIYLGYLKDVNKKDPEKFKLLLENQYNQRLVLNSVGYDVLPWEGITWVIDLLPHFPNQAIESINAYVLAHAQELPDGRLRGLNDATQIIRAKYIGLPGTKPETIEFLQNMNSRDFEHLIERLYNSMGYDTELTPPQKDGGRDIIVKHTKPAKREILLIECKRYRGTVGVEVVNRLLGIVSSEKANKGVLVTSGKFTKYAQIFSKENPRIELISNQELIPLLNEHLGPKWTSYIDSLLLESKKKFMQS